MAQTTNMELSVALASEFDQISWNEEKELIVMASITAPPTRNERPPIDLVCVIDKSSSMSGDLLKLVLRSVNFIIKNLQDTDFVSVVSYDHRVQLVCPFTQMTTKGKEFAKSKVNQIRFGGQTNLLGGLLKGIEEMRGKPREEGRVRTVMLFTDGEANVGYCETEEIIRAVTDRHFASKSEGCEFMLPGKLGEESDETLPCSLFTFGFGRSHSVSLLSALAEHGKGVYYFIDTEQQIAVIFRDCLAGLVSIVSEQIVLTVEVLKSQQEGLVDGSIVAVLNSGLESKRLAQQSFEVSLGDIQTEETKDVLLTVKAPKLAKPDPDYMFVRAQIKYFNVIDKRTEIVYGQLSLNRSEDEFKESYNLEIIHQKNRILAANAIKKASLLAEVGDLAEARKIITEAREKMTQSKVAHEDRTGELYRNLRHCEDGLVSQRRYKARGAQIIKCYEQSHNFQRVALPQYDQTYANKERFDFYARSDSDDSDCEVDYGRKLSPCYSVCSDHSMIDVRPPCDMFDEPWPCSTLLSARSVRSRYTSMTSFEESNWKPKQHGVCMTCLPGLSIKNLFKRNRK